MVGRFVHGHRISPTFLLTLLRLLQLFSFNGAGAVSFPCTHSSTDWERMRMALVLRIICAELDGPCPRSLRMQFVGEGAELLARGVQGWEHASILELSRKGGLG